MIDARVFQLRGPPFKSDLTSKAALNGCMNQSKQLLLIYAQLVSRLPNDKKYYAVGSGCFSVFLNTMLLACTAPVHIQVDPLMRVPRP